MLKNKKEIVKRGKKKEKVKWKRLVGNCETKKKNGKLCMMDGKNLNTYSTAYKS